MSPNPNLLMPVMQPSTLYGNACRCRDAWDHWVEQHAPEFGFWDCPLPCVLLYTRETEQQVLKCNAPFLAWTGLSLPVAQVLFRSTDIAYHVQMVRGTQQSYTRDVEVMGAEGTVRQAQLWCRLERGYEDLTAVAVAFLVPQSTTSTD
jgi:hypothetical protein